MRKTAAFLLSRCVSPELAAAAHLAQAREVIDFGPVPPHTLAGCPVLAGNTAALPQHGLHNDFPRPAIPCDRPSLERRNRLAVALFAMSRLVPAEAQALLSIMTATAEYLFLADIKQPERNLELPGSLLLRGLIRPFVPMRRSFLRQGGLEGAIYAAKDLAPVHRRTLLAGGIQCVLLRALSKRENDGLDACPHT